MNRSWMLVVVIALGCAVEPADDGGESSSGESGTSEEAGSESTEASASGSGESGSSGSGESGSSESGGNPFDLGCDDPQPVMQSDGVTPSGFVRCSDGFRHRVEAVTCVVPEAGTCDDCGADCGDGLERCVEDSGRGTCSCIDSCETDADCGGGQVCACTGVVGDVPRCVPAACDTTADCAEGLCGISGSNNCGFDSTLACLDASSECRTTTCDDETECACYASGGEYVCHDECFSGCG